jgi:hypothetical protein
MTSIFARFEHLSTLMQSLVFVALTAPLFAAFAIAGDLPRGTLAWTFSGALLIALNAHKETTSFRQLGFPAIILIAFHLPLVIWDPLKHAPFFGGIVTPIVMADYCFDYAFLWLWLKLFKTNE